MKRENRILFIIQVILFIAVLIFVHLVLIGKFN